MWARVIECMLAGWLAISPFVFRMTVDDTWLWANALSGAVLVAVPAMLSFHASLKRIHLLHLITATWLIAIGAWSHDMAPPPPAYQNFVVVGLLLLMFAVVPSHSTRPPKAWRRFYAPESK